jgi:AcrR family transcriptional regulator
MRQAPPAVSSEQANWRAYVGAPLKPILESALESFVVQGYHGTSMRTLASNAGLSVPGLYHHYPSKQAILVAIMERAMDDLYERSVAALLEAGNPIVDQLRLHIECLVLFHAYRGPLAFIAASEIRSLEPEARERYIAARDRQQSMLEAIVEAGVEQGYFTTPYPHDVTRALITMCTAVSQWYTTAGPLSPEELARRYVDMAMTTLGVKPVDSP